MWHRNIKIVGLLFAAIIVVINCNPRQNPFKQLERQCQQKSDITDNQMKQYRNNDYDNMDKNLKCYIHCLMEHMGYLQSDHHLNVQRIMQYEEMEPSYENFIDQCNNKYNAVNDPCDYGFNILQCIRKMRNDGNVFHAPKYYSTI